MGVVVQCADCRGKIGDEIFCGKDRLRAVEAMRGGMLTSRSYPGVAMVIEPCAHSHPAWHMTAVETLLRSHDSPPSERREK
jgi:hypothetical protein